MSEEIEFNRLTEDKQEGNCDISFSSIAPKLKTTSISERTELQLLQELATKQSLD